MRSVCTFVVVAPLAALLATGAGAEPVGDAQSHAAVSAPSLNPVPRANPLPPSDPAADKLAFQLIAQREAKDAGLPFSLVDAVIKIESDYRPDRIGDVGEIGLMQVRPTTAAGMGFRGSAAELADPATNIHYGAAYLGAAWRLAKGNVCRTLMKYRAGHGSETMSPLSVTYCQRARLHLASIGSPLAATIVPADLVAVVSLKPYGAMPLRRPDFASSPAENLMAGGRPKTGEAFWAAFGARVRRINAGLEAKWRRTASR